VIKTASLSFIKVYIIKKEADYQSFYHILALGLWFCYTCVAGLPGGFCAGLFFRAL
jgi:hypothetical protein